MDRLETKRGKAKNVETASINGERIEVERYDGICYLPVGEERRR